MTTHEASGSTKNKVREWDLIGISLRVAWQFLGLPYRWGGDDPMQGFDCSGFIIELLKSTGILSRKMDTTAHGLWMMFANNEVAIPVEGCLVFWKRSDGRIIHVEMCIDERRSIGASGGGGTTVTIEDAIQKNAYIKIRPFRTRPHIKGFLDPFMKGGGSDVTVET